MTKRIAIIFSLLSLGHGWAWSPRHSSFLRSRIISRAKPASKDPESKASGTTDDDFLNAMDMKSINGLMDAFIDSLPESEKKEVENYVDEDEAGDDAVDDKGPSFEDMTPFEQKRYFVENCENAEDNPNLPTVDVGEF
jgi:hypothetical protein